MTRPQGRPRGRPRAFDRDAALDAAMLVFWEHGFDATSIAELTAAMGIGAPSLYAAFGDKKTLFKEVVERYDAGPGAFAGEALTAAPDARAGVAQMLHAAATAYTRPERPRGCLVITAATNCTAESADIEQHLRSRRNANVRDLERRICADIDAGALPPDTDAPVLATLTAATLQGMSQQARDGAGRTRLTAVAKAAMRAWP